MNFYMNCNEIFKVMEFVFLRWIWVIQGYKAIEYLFFKVR